MAPGDGMPIRDRWTDGDDLAAPVVEVSCDDGLLTTRPLALAALVNGARPVTDRKGFPGRALEFDGIDAFIEFADDAALPMGTNDRTVSLWCCPAHTKDGTRLISSGQWRRGGAGVTFLL